MRNHSNDYIYFRLNSKKKTKNDLVEIAYKTLTQYASTNVLLTNYYRFSDKVVYVSFGIY